MAEFNCSENFKYYILHFYAEKTWRYTFGVVLAILSLLTVVINAVVLITLLKYEALKIPSFKLLRSLALSDFLTGAFAGSMAAVQLLKEYTETDCFVDMVCTYLEFLFIGTSALTLACISYDRYLHLSKLNKYRMSNRRIYVFMSICWLIPIAVIIITALVNFYISSIVIVTLAVIVLITLTSSYISILVALKRHGKQCESTGNNNQRRAARTVIIILSCFLIMFLPYLISFSILFTRKFSIVTEKKWFVLSTCFGVLNSLLNPIIISCNTPSIQRCIKEMLGVKEMEDDSQMHNLNEINESRDHERNHLDASI